MIIAIHDENITLQGVTYLIDGVYVEVPKGTSKTQARVLYTEFIRPKPKDELEKLDKENELTQRNLRDFMLVMVAALNRIQRGENIDLSQLKGIQDVMEVEAKAAEFRSQITDV